MKLTKATSLESAKCTSVISRHKLSVQKVAHCSASATLYSRCQITAVVVFLQFTCCVLISFSSLRVCLMF